jgi:hypothetical protein
MYLAVAFSLGLGLGCGLVYYLKSLSSDMDFLKQKCSCHFGQIIEGYPFWRESFLDLLGKDYVKSKYFAYESRISTGWNFRIEEYFGTKDLAVQICWLTKDGFLVPVRMNEYRYSSTSEKWDFPDASWLVRCAALQELPPDYHGEFFFYRKDGTVEHYPQFDVKSFPKDAEHDSSSLWTLCCERWNNFSTKG